MKILAIKHQSTKAGKPMIIISTADRDVWVTPKQFTSKGGSASLDSYVGGNIDVDYYAKGDALLNGQQCIDDNVILRDFVISANPAVLANALAIESAMRMQNAVDSSALFARNRKGVASLAQAESLNS